jgi:hypothetical protein
MFVQVSTIIFQLTKNYFEKGIGRFKKMYTVHKKNITYISSSCKNT